MCTIVRNFDYECHRYISYAVQIWIIFENIYVLNISLCHPEPLFVTIFSIPTLVWGHFAVNQFLAIGMLQNFQMPQLHSYGDVCKSNICFVATWMILITDFDQFYEMGPRHRLWLIRCFLDWISAMVTMINKFKGFKRITNNSNHSMDCLRIFSS